MGPSACFSEMLGFVKAQSLPLTVKSYLETELSYFERQALCDPNRRHSTQVIKQKWNAFENAMAKTGLFKKYQSDSKFLETVEYFVGANSIGHLERIFKDAQEKARFTESKLNPVRQQASPNTTTWEAKDFFIYLEEKVGKVSPSIGETEKDLLLYRIKFLSQESQRGRATRNMKEIAKTWKNCKPLLEKLKILEEFKDADQLRSRIRFFLTGRLG